MSSLYTCSALLFASRKRFHISRTAPSNHIVLSSSNKLRMLGVRGTGLLSAPAAHLARRTIVHRRVSAAAVTLETATKQNVGAAASKSQTHVGLNSGHLMPLFGWGTSGVKDAACITATKKAVELGYRHIDTAEMYGNQAEIGKGLHELLEAGALKREDIFVTSKLGNDHHDLNTAKQAIKDTLSQLQLDYVDLYLIHWPVSAKPGPEVDPPFAELWKVMEGFVEQGLVKSIGVSNFSPEKIQSFMPGAKIRPSVNQIEMHAFWRNDRALKWCNQQGIHVTAYGPLSSPATAANMDKTHLNLMEKDVVNEIAEKLGKTPTQVLLRWGLQHGSSVIPKSGDEEHQKENLGALGWELSEEDCNTLSNLPQERIFSGDGIAIDGKGPWRNYEELWNEPKVAPTS